MHVCVNRTLQFVSRAGHHAKCKFDENPNVAVCVNCCHMMMEVSAGTIEVIILICTKACKLPMSTEYRQPSLRKTFRRFTATPQASSISYPVSDRPLYVFLLLLTFISFGYEIRKRK